MNDKAYEARRHEFAARRKYVNPTFQVRRMGNRWYVIEWPGGDIRTGHRSEEEAVETARMWAATQLLAQPVNHAA